MKRDVETKNISGSSKKESEKREVVFRSEENTES